MTAIATIGNFLNQLGYKKQCEAVYVKYIQYYELIKDKNHQETALAYYMVGIYYFE